MKKIFYTLALCGLVVPSISARTLSVDEAKANVAAFTSSSLHKAPALKSGGMRLAGTFNKDGMPTLYVFTSSDSKGVVVASASDLTPAVLGYADSGVFDMNSMPPSMKALLEDYSSEIAMAEAGKTVRVAYKAGEEKQAIAPLCKTQWNQNAPFNDLTPELSGQHCMTGCVATAMAQVMKVFEWPAEHGEGFVSYLWSAGAQQLSYNLANSTMDWDNMLDVYGSDATAEQNAAVASLMRDCGYATDMQYTLNASGTTAVKIPTALYYNFGYDKNVHTLQRAYYSLSEWENIVYNELKNGSPVIVTGVSNAQGGHCFVCDGYSSDRYYHINWGWGGMSDGYFLLTALNPETQGIGGSTGGFNNYTNICVGIKKPVEGSELFMEIISEGAFGTEQEVYGSDQNVVFTSEGFVNTCMETENGYFGVKLTDAQGNVSYVQAPDAFELETYYGTKGYYIPANLFPTSGTYTVTPAWFNSANGKWDDVKCLINEVSSLSLTVADGTLSFTPIAVNADLEVKNVKLLTDIYTNTNFEISGELTNKGSNEFYGEVMVALLDAENVLQANTASFSVDVEAGQSQPLQMVAKFQRAPAAGTYYLCFATTDGKVISEPMEVELTAITGKTSVSIDNLRMTSGNGGNPPVVPSNDVSVAGTLVCTNGYFNNTMTAYIFPQRGGNSLGTVGSDTFFVHADESKDFEFKGSFGNGVEGTTYQIGFFYNNTQIPNAYVYFVLGEPTSVQVVEGVDDVVMAVVGDTLCLQGTDTATIDIYAASGVHVMSVNGVSANIAALVPGSYIAVAQTSNGPVMFKFIK